MTQQANGDMQPSRAQNQGNDLATEIATLAPSLSGAQERYLVHLAATGDVSSASRAAEIKSPTVRGWRHRTPGFSAVEALTLENRASFGERIADAILNNNAGVAATVLLTK